MYNPIGADRDEELAEAYRVTTKGRREVEDEVGKIVFWMGASAFLVIALAVVTVITGVLSIFFPGVRQIFFTVINWLFRATP